MLKRLPLIFLALLLLISAAAFLVKVIAAISSGLCTRASSTR